MNAEGCLPLQQFVLSDDRPGMVCGGTSGGLAPAAVIHDGINKTASRLQQGVFEGEAEAAREESARIARGLLSNPTQKHSLHTSTEWSFLLPASLETDAPRFHPLVSVFVRCPCRRGVGAPRHCTPSEGNLAIGIAVPGCVQGRRQHRHAALREVKGGTLPRRWTPMVVGH